MSTTATIHLEGMREDFYIDGDGYPDEITPYLIEAVKKAKEKAERNPDFSIIQITLLELIEIGFDIESYSDHCVDYEYKVSKDGEIAYRLANLKYEDTEEYREKRKWKVLPEK